MTSAARRLKTVTREEADRIARSGLSTVSICLWCAGLMVIPTVALAVVLAALS
jgi:hypothetical protein